MFHHVTARLALSLVLALAATAAWACGGGGGGYYGGSYHHYGNHGQGFTNYYLADNREQGTYVYGSYPVAATAMETPCGVWYGRGSACNGSGAYCYPSAGMGGHGY